MSQSQQLARPAPLVRGVSVRMLRAFTLVELLIVIAIIGVLTAMSLSLLSGASNDAKKSATQARMSQIAAILQLQMEDYEVRRLPLSNRVLTTFIEVPANASTITQQDGTSIGTRLRLKYLRRQLLMDLINSEMPRPTRSGGNLGDPLTYGPVIGLGETASTSFVPNIGNFPDTPTPFPISSTANNFRNWLGAFYPVANASGFTLAQAVEGTASGSVKSWGRFRGNIQDRDNGNEVLPGEFLHEILRQVQVDGQSAVELLGNSAINDTDGDGVPEIVDAWGDPMVFDIEQLPVTVSMDNAVTTNNAAGFNPIPLDPRIPRALGDLRIVVGSTRIPESLPIIERASRGIQ